MLAVRLLRLMYGVNTVHSVTLCNMRVKSRDMQRGLSPLQSTLYKHNPEQQHITRERSSVVY
jgi:hypothetical protein